jgi:sulfatase modifying factor 1
LAKRLCGKIGGGTADPGAYLDANSNEWFRACSAGSGQKYPYGNDHGPGKCNDISAPTTSPIDVGSYAQCVGGYPGLYDMSGNVREWEASCNVNGCYARGGAYVDLQDNVACSAAILTTRSAATKELGFRCCSD